MRALVAVTLFGPAKNYVLPAFCRMAEACIPDDCDITVYGDQPLPGWLWKPMQCASSYAEDMLWVSRAQAVRDAVDGGYDQLVLHGVDALWQTPAQFELLLHASRDIRSPLISARGDASYPVSRRFKTSPTSEFLEEQEELSPQMFTSGTWIRNQGFPGADNIMISRRAFSQVNFDGHVAWYDRVAAGRPNLCVEEFWCLKALRAGFDIWTHTGVKVWHVHETGAKGGGPLARMYPGIEKPLKDLRWK